VSANWFKTYITNRKQKVKIASQNHKGDSLCRWETIKNDVPQGSILGPLLFIIYVNDLSCVINQLARPVIYADDTSVLVTAKNLKDLQIKVISTLYHISDWFSSNGLILNIGMTNVTKFYSNHFQNNLQQSAFKISTIKEVTNIKFLGLKLDNNINWKHHVAKILPKLSRACYSVRSMYPFSSINTLKMIYFAYFHSIINYGIIFWGNSTESKKGFLAQKEIIRIMTGSRPKTLFKPLFQSLEIVTLHSQYILSLMKFLLQNQEMFISNSEVHNINTRNKSKLQKPISNLALYQKGVYNMVIRIFNKLPEYIANLLGNERILKQP
jgi:hypothetical protein